MLLRGPALPASAAAVARVLHEAGYQAEEVATHPHPDKQRQFERATPNQLWQTDLFTFVLKRQNRRVYMVAFMDDHSRFITGYGIHASQSAALVLEVVRAAIVAYGTPQEMLTDNGSQYVTWRGTSAFHREMDKRGIKHIVARPQRPQTLGKIERFWGTLWRECIETSVFFDLEDARRRIGHFIDYYNFQRPHQGIDGLVPADRFFGAASEVLATLRARVAANALELARNGVPKAPFYVTGRIGERAFSVHAEGRTDDPQAGRPRPHGGRSRRAARPRSCRWSTARRRGCRRKCPCRSARTVRLPGDVVEDEVPPGGSPLDAGLRRLEAVSRGAEGRAERHGSWPRRDIMSGSPYPRPRRPPRPRTAEWSCGGVRADLRVKPQGGRQPRCAARGGGDPGGAGRRADADGGRGGHERVRAALLPLGTAGLGGPGAGLRTAAAGQGRPASGTRSPAGEGSRPPAAGLCPAAGVGAGLAADDRPGRVCPAGGQGPQPSRRQERPSGHRCRQGETAAASGGAGVESRGRLAGHARRE